VIIPALIGGDFGETNRTSGPDVADNVPDPAAASTDLDGTRPLP